MTDHPPPAAARPGPGTLQGALAGYARRLHAAAGTGQHVVSPLGAWLLLALCAGADDDRLDPVLGVASDRAAGVVGDLLTDPHPVVAAALGAWARRPASQPWATALPAGVETGPIPTQPDLDAWAARHSLGLIKRFPLEIDDDTVILLASALATKVAWMRPFTVVEATQLGTGPWATGLRTVLRTPTPAAGSRQYLAETAEAGLVGVHIVEAKGGLAVGSVIAADESAAPGDVLAAAYSVLTGPQDGAGRRSLWDLPISDDTKPWTIDEQDAPVSAPEGREEAYVSVLPAWEAKTTISLDDPSLGFALAADILGRRIGRDGLQTKAIQSAVATYTATGFEAAAVTASAFMASALRRTRPGRRRTATLQFRRPYAVVAYVPEKPLSTSAHLGGSPAWHGLSVFSAWISDPVDA